MNEMVGDDTALAAILSSAIYSKSVKYVATGCDLLDLRLGPKPSFTLSSNSSLPT